MLARRSVHSTAVHRICSPTASATARDADYGALAFYANAELNFEQMRIDGTMAAACATSSCTDAPGGSGLALAPGATATLTGFDISDNESAGLALFDDTSLEGQRGTIHGNTIGVNFESTSLEMDEILRDVVVSDNEDDIAMEELGPPVFSMPD